MKRRFHVTGSCSPERHYMVRLDSRLEKIKEDFVDYVSYFVINKGRQYGKTTTLRALEDYLKEKSSPLFESMAKQPDTYTDLYKIVEAIMYCGKKIPFSLEEKSISLGSMFGYLKEEKGYVAIANRMFAMCLFNMFMAKEAINSDVYAQGGSDRIGFIKDNMLDMTLVLKKFVEYFAEICGQKDQNNIST